METPKYGTSCVPGRLKPGRGTQRLKYGTSREIRDGWQAYVRAACHSSHLAVHLLVSTVLLSVTTLYWSLCLSVCLSQQISECSGRITMERAKLL